MQVHHRGAGVHCWGAHQAWCKGVVIFGWKAKILIPRFTLLSWQFKDSSLRSESVNECLNHGYSKMFLRCELNETEGVGNRLRASNLSYEKKTDMLFFVFFAVLNLKTFSEDNCPWAAIASLALHKLFTDWQSQGYTLPKVSSKLWYEIFSHVQLVKLLGTWKSASRFWFFKWRRRT